VGGGGATASEVERMWMGDKGAGSPMYCPPLYQGGAIGYPGRRPMLLLTERVERRIGVL